MAGLSAQRRVLALAFVGGIAVAHHRLIVCMAPGLLIAALPPLWREQRQDVRRVVLTLIAAVPIALIGFLPYLYLPMRANTPTVYGSPGTLQGFWNEFTAREANNLMHLPANPAALLADLLDTLKILADQMTLPGALLGVIALVAVIVRPRYRLMGCITGICAVGFVIFSIALHQAVVPQAVIVPVVMMLAFALALLSADILDTQIVDIRLKWALPLIAAVGLMGFNFGFIFALTHDDSGLRAIQVAKSVPRENGTSVFMLPWSARYNAVRYSKYVTNENADLPLVDHNADFTALRLREKLSTRQRTPCIAFR